MFNIHRNHFTHAVRQESSCTSDSDGLYDLDRVVQDYSHRSKYPEGFPQHPNVSQALLPLGFPSLLFTLLPRVVKTLQWISASEILLQTQQMKTAFIQSAITGSVFTHNSSPVNYRSLSLTKIRFNLYTKSLFAKT